MKKFILIPDSFKGTLSSIEVCNIIEPIIQGKYLDADIIKIPVADGGEGSVDAFIQAVGGEKKIVEVCGPYFEKRPAFYGLINNRTCAVIEMAAAAGLPLVQGRENPALTTTYGVGELIRHAIDDGVQKIIIGLGGSCTNDGGVGCAAALGITFYNQQGQAFIPTGGTLSQIATIDTSNRYPRLGNVEIITMCDIDNPLFGPDGAAYVFSPQKGANPNMVEHLDQNLQHLARVVEKNIGVTEWNFIGAGAAGGMGYGMRVFLDSKIQMGIDVILDLTNFESIIQGTDYIITGEGKLDSQSLRGKVVIGVARRAKRYNKKVIAVVGCTGPGYESAYQEGDSEIIVTNYENLPFSEVIPRAQHDMITAVSKWIKQLPD